ncbi:MAG: hypothetical protein BWY91_01876 [bacterium ADurb.BinA028]|nr:MAG: hypothetical protein BWY91_01876 [bacterium ADurb.BinA028]
MDGRGRPVGTVPSTATPWFLSWKTVHTTVATATAMSVAGQRCLTQWMSMRKTNVPIPTQRVNRCVPLATPRKDWTCSTMLSPWTFVPVILPSWPTTMRTAAPAR